MEHTKTPWEARPSGPKAWIVESGNIVIARFDRSDKPEWNKANAEFIVKAVNSHDDLLAACKETEWVAMDSLAKWRCPSCMNSKKNGHRHDCKKGQAIAKAESD